MGTPQWRHLTALFEYYQNGPLPNWIGWYVQQLPHGFHSFIALATLILELGAVWMLFLPRRWRIACFCVVSPFQLGIILTANLAFINHLVLILGVLLLDDRCLQPVRARGGRIFRRISTFDFRILRRPSAGQPVEACDPGLPLPEPGLRTSASRVSAVALALKAILLTWIFYNTTALLTLMLAPYLPLPASPIAALEPFRISNQYGLFATMTRARYEIEFQGSNDGKQWTAYPFKYKPQDPSTAPRIYAPYQPRFDWNLWFASLGSWREYPWYCVSRSFCFKTTRACSRSLPVTPLEAGRLNECGPYCGNTGLPIGLRSAPPDSGGGESFVAFMLLSWIVSRMARS